MTAGTSVAKQPDTFVHLFCCYRALCWCGHSCSWRREPEYWAPVCYCTSFHFLGPRSEGWVCGPCLLMCSGAVDSARVAKELGLWTLSMFSPLFQLPYALQFTHLQMHWYVDLSGILVCWAEELLSGYRYLTSYRLKGRKKGIISLWDDAYVTYATFSLSVHSSMNT